MHIPLNLGNFLLIGLGASVFVVGGRYVLKYLQQTSIPVVSGVASSGYQLLTNV